MRKFKVFGNGFEFSEAKKIEGAVFSRVHGVRAVKNADLLPEDQIARLRAVYGGNNVFDCDGHTVIFQRLYMLPANLVDVRIFFALARLLGLVIRQGDVSGIAPNSIDGNLDVQKHSPRNVTSRTRFGDRPTQFLRQPGAQKHYPRNVTSMTRYGDRPKQH